MALLLDRGVELNRRYEHDLTALMWAAGSGDEKTVRVLLDRGAELDSRDDRGMTAAQIARKLGHEKIAALIEGKAVEGR